MLVVLSSVLALAITPVLAQSAELSLSCSGRTTEMLEYKTPDWVKTGWDATITLHIDGEAGIAVLPRQIGGENHAALLLGDIRSSATTIRGKIRYDAMAYAKIKFDRRSQLISIIGPKGNFSGKCISSDPDNPQAGN